MKDGTVWQVYGLIDPRDRAVFYVGMSTAPQRRLRQHLTDASSPAWKVLQEIGEDVEICFFGTFVSKKQAKVLEGRLILAIPSLVNSKTYHALPSEKAHGNWRHLDLVENVSK